MSKLTSIKDKIKQLEGGAFQEFCDQYLARKGYDGIFELGMQSGTMKTTTGNPDTYFKSKSGKYIFVAYTTQKSNINTKIEEDIMKCLDKSKTGINICDIEEIICCHTSSTLDAGKDKSLHEMCELSGVLLSLYGIDRIANDIYQYFKFLAKDFLGISIDTNQISSISEFVSRYDSNEIAAPLETKFQFRDNELKNVIEAIDINKVVVVFGKAGVGKTRVVIEACKIFSEQNKYRLLCIRSNDLPIFEDITSYIQVPGKYLVFIDDANELNGLKHVLQYLNLEQQGYNVKIIATVRDYARKHVVDEIKGVSIPVKIEIGKFSDKEIKEFLEENLEIKNDLYLEQIVNISEGNPRIAFLAGKLAKENQKFQSIQDATQLYEVYYGKYIHKNIISTDRKVCLSAGIIALLQTINLEYLDKLKPVFDLVHMSTDEFVENLRLLHGMEFVEIHYDKVASISDQCLSNYMLYYTFFERKIVMFSEILDIGFRNFRRGVIRATNILLNIFHSEQTRNHIEKEVSKLWNKYKIEEQELFFEFLKAFHGFKPEESLLYLQENVECMNEEVVDLRTINFDKNIGRIDDEILLTLSGYRHSAYVMEALELMFIYCQKRQRIAAETVNTITTYFGVDRQSYRNDYYSLRNVAKVLSEHYNDNKLMKNLTINIAKKMLILHFSSTEASRGNSVTIYNIPIQLTEGSKEYRNIFWSKLIELSEDIDYKEEILNFINTYSQEWYEEIDIRVLEFDLPYIECLIENISEISIIRTAKICNQLIKKCNHYSILINNVFEKLFDSQEWIIYVILSEKYYGDDISYEEGEARRKRIIEEYAKNYEENKLKEFISICNNIGEELSNDSFGFNQGLSMFYQALENNKSKYLEIVKFYFDNGSNLDIYPRNIIIKLFEYLDVDRTFCFISENNFMQKNVWLFAFFEELPENVLNDKWIDELLGFLKKDDDKNIKSSPYRNLRFLDKYRKLRPSIYIDVINIINEKFQYSKFIAHIYLGLIFNEGVYKPIEIINIFKDEILLLKEIYFKMIEYDSHEDCSGEYIKVFIENDTSWLKLYIKYVINSENSRQYSEYDRIGACWESDNYQEIFDIIFYEIVKVDGYYKWQLVSFFKQTLKNRSNEQNKVDNQTKWLKHIISDNCKDEIIIDIFRVISDLRAEVRKECIIYFVNLNNDYELFKRLELEPNHWGGIGSMEERIRFYESLLEYFTGLQLLKHKNLLVENINIWKRRIENEQIQEILEERIF